MDVDEFLRWDASQPRCHELVRGIVRPDPVADSGGDHAMQCLNVCLSVQDRMVEPDRWHGGQSSASRGQIRCGTGNVRLVDAVVSCTGGPLDREEYGLVVMCPAHRPPDDFDDCLRDVLETPEVLHVLSADFIGGDWVVYRRRADGSWRRDHLTGHDWALRLSGLGGTVDGGDLDDDGQCLGAGFAFGG